MLSSGKDLKITGEKGLPEAQVWGGWVINIPDCNMYREGGSQSEYICKLPPRLSLPARTLTHSLCIYDPHHNPSIHAPRPPCRLTCASRATTWSRRWTLHCSRGTVSSQRYILNRTKHCHLRPGTKTLNPTPLGYLRYGFVVVDESHCLKGRDTKRTQVWGGRGVLVVGFYSDRRLLR